MRHFCPLKISQEVREFAAKQNADPDSFLAASAPVEDAEAGMEEMSRVYKEKGERLYLPEV